MVEMCSAVFRPQLWLLLGVKLATAAHHSPTISVFEFRSIASSQPVIHLSIGYQGRTHWWGFFVLFPPGPA